MISVRDAVRPIGYPNGIPLKMQPSPGQRPGNYLWPPPMNVVEASFNGTLRTILVLVIAWWVLRLIVRYQRAHQAPPPHTTHTPQRPQGDVRIERADERQGPGRQGGPIVDADFEEIK